ncbi:arabinofuranosidase catalytic domain-containing protein [Aquimarina sp. W85]|uniref:arabinofuranosidase catalytic domain-containing protein n=1 Tax=Aquimarina rhodophyticola TaxID=3342246 RepID=UPI003671FD7D
MKTFLIYFYFLCCSLGYAQIALSNHFPTLQPSHIIDEKLTNISFALSMRVVESNYNGPLIRLRRDSDNAVRDFWFADNDIVDVAAIDAWRGNANVFVVIWYDQSGLGRNATQNTNAFQPQFITDPSRPYFVGDGTNDRLDINTSIQVLTNAGVNGSIFTVIFSTSNNQFSMGTRRPGNSRDRWSIHLNWTDNNVYFDSGFCCIENVRSAQNPNNQWQQLSFIRANIIQSIRRSGVELNSGNYTQNPCTATNNFGILYANGINNEFANNRFTEIIMYNTDIELSDIQEIEENQITFWNL